MEKTVLQWFLDILYPTAYGSPRFKSFLEIVKDFSDSLSEADLNAFLEMEREDLIQLHHTVGRHIRNKYDLWNIDNPLTLDKHPDDLSFEIIVAAHERLTASR
jgi:hypothetical protein